MAATELCTTDPYGRYIPRTGLSLRGCKIKVLANVEPRVATILQNVRMAATPGKTAPALATASLSVTQ